MRRPHTIAQSRDYPNVRKLILTEWDCEDRTSATSTPLQRASPYCEKSFAALGPSVRTVTGRKYYSGELKAACRI